MTQPQREQWSSQLGFLLAALGSAVGLGNVWRFAYVAGENGGGAFLLVYLVMILLVGVPLLLGEFALGRSTHMESASALRAVAPASRWGRIGLLGVLASVLILAYYAVIAGWVLRYLALYLGNATQELASTGYRVAFDHYVTRTLEPLAWQGLALLPVILVITRGVEKGIERISLLLMPALALLLLALAIYSATLPGFARGAAFLFQPDWSALLRPEVYLAALGQAFFSIGLAMGVMVTYGSYQSGTRHLPRSAFHIALGDTLFAITAGLVVFPAVFSYGLDPAQGPGLAFAVLPEVFARMPGGTLVGGAFFLLLAIAALTSMISLLEVPVAWVVQRYGGSRRRAAWRLGAVVFLLGIPASLGFGLLSGVRTTSGLGVLDAMDYLAVDVLLPLNGLLLAVFIGWIWPRGEAMQASDLAESPLGRLWHANLRYLVPVLVGLVLLSALV